MLITRFLAACLLTTAAGLASAIDPSDEDISYLPDNILNTLGTPRYGHDPAAYRKCVAAGGTDAKTDAGKKQLAEQCRIKATPKKCRELSPLPPEKGSKSAQESCAQACRKTAADKACAIG